MIPYNPNALNLVVIAAITGYFINGNRGTLAGILIATSLLFVIGIWPTRTSTGWK